MDIYLLPMFLFAAFGIQMMIKEIITYLNTSIKSNMDSLLGSMKDDEKKILIDEIISFKLIQKKQQALGFITTIVGLGEIFGFSFLAYHLWSTERIEFHTQLGIIGTAATAWLVIKIFGGYQQWAGAVYGRATFYVFLIGSIMNIVGAVLLGILWGYI